jgi:hypothetical protein
MFQLLPEANLCVVRGASLCFQYRILKLLEEYPDISRDGSSQAHQTIIIAMQGSSKCREDLVFVGRVSSSCHQKVLLLAEETFTVLQGIKFGGSFLQISCTQIFFTFGVNEKPLVLPTEVKG